MSGKSVEPSSLPTLGGPEQTGVDAQEFLASIVQQSEDAIIGCTPDGIIVSWNRGAQKLFGYGSHEIIGKNLVVLATDEAAPTLKTAIERMKRGKAIFPFDGNGVTKDGRHIEISCSASPVKDARGRLMGVAAILRDNSERKRADEARALLAAVVEFSEEGILAVSVDKKVLSWNRGAEAIYGYSAEEIIGKSVTSTIIPPERMEEYDRSFGRVLAGETLVRFESQRYRNDGGLVEVALTFCPIKNQQGKVVGVSAVVRDITQAKATQTRQHLHPQFFSGLTTTAADENKNIALLIIPREAVGTTGTCPSPRAGVLSISRSWAGSLW